MKKIVLLFIAALTLTSVAAQDIIIKKSGDVIKAYSVEITDKSIYYKEYANDSDNIKRVAKDELIMIKKADDSIVSFMGELNGADSSIPSGAAATASTAAAVGNSTNFSYLTDEILYNISDKGAVADYVLYLGKKKRFAWNVHTKVIDVKRANDKIEIESLYTFLDKKKKKPSANAKLSGFADGFYISTFIKDGVWRVTQDYVFGYAKNMTTSGYVVEIPYDIKVGDELQTSTLNIKGEFMRKDFACTLNYENFVVVKQEDVTTPAGVFRCYKIEGRISGEYNTMPIDNTQEWWINKEIGIVKIKTDYYGGMEYVLETLSK